MRWLSNSGSELLLVIPVQRVVDDSGSLVERNLNESGEVLDEAVVGDASEAGSEKENANEG